MKAKLFISVVTIGVITSIQSWGATSLDWVSQYVNTGSGLPDIVDMDGNELTTSSDWYFQLYDTSTAWNFGGDRTEGELYSTTDGVNFSNGLLWRTIDEIYPWGSEKTVGTRLYNSSDPSTATAYAVATQTGTIQSLTGNPDLDPTSLQYDVGKIRQEDWVPEPMTTMLALVGVGTVIYRRRRMRNK